MQTQNLFRSILKEEDSSLVLNNLVWKSFATIKCLVGVLFFRPSSALSDMLKAAPSPTRLHPPTLVMPPLTYYFYIFTQLLHNLILFYLSDELHKVQSNILVSRLPRFVQFTKFSILPITQQYSSGKKGFQHSYDMTSEGNERMFCSFLCLFW